MGVYVYVFPCSGSRFLFHRQKAPVKARIHLPKSVIVTQVFDPGLQFVVRSTSRSIQYNSSFVFARVLCFFCVFSRTSRLVASSERSAHGTHHGHCTFWARYQFCRIYFKICRSGAPAKILKKFAVGPDFHQDLSNLRCGVGGCGLG